jgi:hypothetical protein
MTFDEIKKQVDKITNTKTPDCLAFPDYETPEEIKFRKTKEKWLKLAIKEIIKRFNNQ